MTMDKFIETTDEFEKTINLPVDFKKEITLSNKLLVTEGDNLADLLELNPIHFNYDNASITKNAEIELQKIIAVLKQNPTMVIELGSHTDNRSSYWYNKKLSVDRMRFTVNI